MAPKDGPQRLIYRFSTMMKINISKAFMLPQTICKKEKKLSQWEKIINIGTKSHRSCIWYHGADFLLSLITTQYMNPHSMEKYQYILLLMKVVSSLGCFPNNKITFWCLNHIQLAPNAMISKELISTLALQRPHFSWKQEIVCF